MDIFLQQLANGVIIGLGYALAAGGLTLVFGILGILNFAHGELFMLGAYGVLVAMQTLGIGYGPAIPIAIVAVVIIGALTKVTVIDPLMKKTAVNTLLGTFALSLLLYNLVHLGMGSTPRRIETPFAEVFQLGPVVLTGQKVVVLIVGGVLLLAVSLVLQRTSIGRLMRCTAQNRRAALLLGVNVRAVENVTFALGMALAAVGGALLGPLAPITPHMGAAIVLKAFAVIVLGGIGFLPGAIAAGLLLGVAEALAAGYLSTTWRDGIAFIVLLAVLAIRPSGMFGPSAAR